MSNKTISHIKSLTSQPLIAEIDKAILELSNKKIVYVLNYGGKPAASVATRLLAARSANSGRNVVLCDTTGQSDKEILKETKKLSTDLPIVNIGENISLLTKNRRSIFFTSKHFNSKIKDLAESFDQVFICSSNSNAQLGLMAVLEFVPGLVIMSGLRKTKKQT